MTAMCTSRHTSSEFSRALLRLFPPNPRDQFGTVGVVHKSVDTQRMQHHALSFAGASATNSFVRGIVRHPETPRARAHDVGAVRPTETTAYVEAPYPFCSKAARLHGCVSVDVEHRAYMYPSAHVAGLRRLAAEMRAANASIAQHRYDASSSSARMHRKWFKGRWHVVDCNSEAQGLDLAGARCTAGGVPEMMWLPPKAVPLVHCAWASGPALGVKWVTQEHLFHASQFAVADLPRYLRSSPLAYFGRTGCRVPLPYAAPALDGAPTPSNTVRSTAELKALMASPTECPQRPPLTTCWFTTADLKALGLAPLPHVTPVTFECVEHFVCVPLSNDRFFDAEVRDTFLTAFPLPTTSSPGVATDAPQVHIFEAASKSWLSFPRSCCTLGIGQPMTAADDIFVDVLAADECGLVDWDPKTHREVLCIPNSPSLTAADPDAGAPPPQGDGSSDLHRLAMPQRPNTHLVVDDGEQDGEEEPCEPPVDDPSYAPWGESRRRPLRAAMASASHILPRDVLVGLCAAATTAAPVEDAPPEAAYQRVDERACCVVACEDVAGTNVVHVRRRIDAYNASHVVAADQAARH